MRELVARKILGNKWLHINEGIKSNKIIGRNKIVEIKEISTFLHKGKSKWDDVVTKSVQEL